MVTIDEAFAHPFAKQTLMAEPLLVVGGGTMGAGIALVAAHAGYHVDVVEPEEASRERGSEHVRREAERSGDSTLAERVRWTGAIPARTDARIAIEAVPERFELKRDVFVALANALALDALLATNTSSLAVADLADAVPHPERVLGMHFFNPPLRMKLIEVVQTPLTSDDALEQGLALVERLGKTAVLTADTPGFIVNRVARPYYLQALRALERGVAPMEELDALARAAGFRMGPFELMDLIGLDVNLATTESIYARTEARRFAPVELQRRMVAQGLLGRKTGAGFYAYRDGKHARFEPAVEEPAGDADVQESVSIVGFAGLADELAEALEARYASVARIENDEMLDDVSRESTIVVDIGDGATDRGDIIAQLDAALGPETVLFADAYASDLRACSQRLRHPERLIGYGILGSLADQSAVEIVDLPEASDEALELAQEFFGSLGKAVMLVEDAPGLFLGRTIGSIVNEAMTSVAEHVASPEDVDAALCLGANYPHGPISWGREIGGARLTRILKRLADAEGEQFAPHRSLWVLDLEDAVPAEAPQ